ncbi:MAG: phage tail tape measure protein [Mixta calida]|nr:MULTISPECIES: phage tail tape measure protein [Pantoea]MBS6436800.1 phage tail tape measure protein [Pantoea sp.]MDU2730966.1 phage tail tape measure protein [Pantoea sp.]MDU2733823.1 phage tail tape measure protein [Mixta calida]DAL31217.1 MAG TPA_asm: minor tail protein [Caudoviricetes sp.]
MSEDLKLQALLKAVNQALRPLQSLQNETQNVASSIADTQQSLAALQAQSAKIDGFRAASRQLSDTQQQLKQAKAETAALALAMRASSQPAEQQSRALEKARQHTAALQSQAQSLRLAVQQQRASLNDAGISTRSLSSEQLRLKAAAAQTSQHLNGHQQQLQRLNQQQERQNQTAERYRKGQALAGQIRSGGAAALGLAKTGFTAGAALLRPGYELARADAALQAKTGLQKGSPQAVALDKQARSLSVQTGVPAQAVAQTQLDIAQAGGSVDDIASATPVALNMAQVNSHSAADNAGLLMDAKSAFGLDSGDIAHLGDVLNATLDQTGMKFEDLSSALSSVAPVAKSAGVGVEQTSAMLGLLAQNHITGAVAGDEVGAILTRLQTREGEGAIAALGVSTRDENGDARQILPLLKDIQAAFASKGMDAAQQTDALKSIVGAKAASSASLLTRGAASGELETLTASVQHADGGTARMAQAQQDSLGGDLQKLDASRAAIGVDLFAPLDGPLRTLTQEATQFLQTIDQWLQDNPTLASGIATAAAVALTFVGALGAIGMAVWPVVSGVGAIMAGVEILGGLFTVVGGAIVTAIGAITLPVVAIVAAIVGGALLIRQYWEPISAFISGVAQGFSAAMGPIGDAFAPLQPVFAWVTDKIKSVWNGFTQLLEPVKATQEQLAAAGDMGKSFGNMLVEALKIPGHALDQLTSGIDWVLNKLGIASSKSKALKADLPPDAAAPESSAAPAASGLQSNLLTSGPTYRPVVAPAAGSMTQQNAYTSNITVNASPGMDPNDVGRIVQQHFAQQQFEQQNRQRSAMTGGFYP